MKTSQIRAKITELLRGCTGNNAVYYRKAKDVNKVSPYVVYGFEQIDFPDSDRDDLKLDIDIWGEMGNTSAVDDLADTIEATMNMNNQPLDGVYPTFYRYDRRVVDDNNADVYRVQIRVLIMSY